MNNKTTRRGFLKGSAVAAGGLLVGTSVEKAEAAIEEAKGLPENEYAIFITDKLVTNIDEIPVHTLAHDFKPEMTRSEDGNSVTLTFDAGGEVWKTGYATHYAIVGSHGLIGANCLATGQHVMEGNTAFINPMMKIYGV